MRVKLGVRCCWSYRLTFTESLLIDWLIRLSFHGVRRIWEVWTGGHTQASWCLMWPYMLSDLRVAELLKQQSTVNALAGVSTANLLSRICTDVAIWTTVGSAVTRAACKFNVGCVVSVLIKLVKLSARFQPFPCWIWSHLTHLLHSLCTNYAVDPAPGPVLSRFPPGTQQKGVFSRCWVTSQFNYSSGIVLSGKYLTTPLWQRHDICILMSIFREKVQVDVFSEGYTCLWTQAGFFVFFRWSYAQQTA